MFDLFSIYIFYYKILYFKISWKEKKKPKRFHKGAPKWKSEDWAVFQMDNFLKML